MGSVSSLTNALVCVPAGWSAGSAVWVLARSPLGDGAPSPATSVTLGAADGREGGLEPGQAGPAKHPARHWLITTRTPLINVPRGWKEARGGPAAPSCSVGMCMWGSLVARGVRLPVCKQDQPSCSQPPYCLPRPRRCPQSAPLHPMLPWETASVCVSCGACGPWAPGKGNRLSRGRGAGLPRKARGSQGPATGSRGCGGPDLGVAGEG